ncbi:MAG: CPBP family intramembrane metalloprotease [Planctomycetes bacterium]|nr:CPBP family intramembrane metalloprotease [Planctomycetota bacterium]MBL7039922.1 CPBP family intramembrane metalloprotease [Pirellulaceae bacterium]
MLENDENTAEKGANHGIGQYPRRRFSASASRFGRLCLKELRETLRDRRTIVTLVLMPLLVYPLLTMAFQRFLVTSFETSREFHIGLSSEETAARIKPLVALGELVLKNEDAGRAKEIANKAAPSMPMAAVDLEPHIQWKTGSNLEQRVEDGSLDLAILLKESDPADASPQRIAPLTCEIVHRADSATSKSALEYVQRRLRAANEHLLREKLRKLGSEPTLSVQAGDRAVGDSGTMLSVTTLIPLVLILMTITGAVYPAIDLTAGERERGTLEALMAAPVPRLGLLAGKYVAVLTVALLTAGANLVAMTVMLTSTGLGTILFGPAGLSPLVLVQVFALLILFAAFFSAILLAVTSFARSFKEAQAYLIPLMLLALAPGVMSLMPELEFNRTWAVTPLVNIVLLARDVFKGTADPGLAAVAVLSTALYAVAAIALAARVFGTDALLYGSEASWSDLFHRPAHDRDAASFAGAMFCMAILFPCSFLTVTLLARLDLSTLGLLWLNAAALALLFGGIPLAAAFVQRVRVGEGFQLRATHPLAFVSAVVIGLAVWPLAHEVFLLNRAIGLATFGEDLFRLVEDAVDKWREVPSWTIVLVYAVVPGVCEELFFRGYLFRAIARTKRADYTILLTAVLFGVFHVVNTGVGAAERFLPSTFLGLVLGWVCWRTGSVLPGMLLHVCHNGLLLMIAYYRDELAARGWGVEEQSHMPLTWLAASTVAVAASIAVIVVAGRRKRLPEKS